MDKNKRLAIVVSGFVMLSLLASFMIASSRDLSLDALRYLRPSNVLSLEVPAQNFYLYSDSNQDSDTFYKTVDIYGNSSEKIKVIRDSLGSDSYSFTSEVIKSKEPIKEIKIYGQDGSSLNADSIQENILAQNFKDEMVLGVTTDVQNELKFLSESGLSVINRETWGAELKEIDSKSTSSDIKALYLYKLDVESEGTDLEKLLNTYNFHKNRCQNNPGLAPISCEESDTFGDIAYNYVVGSDGAIYQGKDGNSGTVGLHRATEENSMSVALIPSSEGAYSDQQIIQATKLISILTELNNVDTKLNFLNAYDDDAMLSFNESFEKIKGSLDTSTPENVQLAVKKSEELLDTEVIVKVDGAVQVIIDGEITEDALEVVKRNTVNSIEIKVKDQVLTTFINEDIVEQTISEIKIIDPDTKIQPNYIYRLESWDNSLTTRSVPSDYSPTTHWYLEKIKMPEAWSDMGGCLSDNTCGGSQTVKVAVLDTGVAYEDYDYDAGDSYTATRFDPFWVEVPGVDTADGGYNEGYDRQYRRHPELSNVTFSNPYDSWQDYSCNVLRLTGSTPDPCNSAEIAKISHANDDHGHGTFVTGIIVANTSDLSPNLVVGIAHNVQIMPIKVFTPNDRSMCLDSNGNIDLTCSYANGDYRSVAFTTTLVYGINHAVNNGAKVINMSLGGPGSDPLVESAITNAVNSDVMVVVASGNDNDDANYYFPANAEGAFTVGSTTPTDTRASYSNYGSVIDLVAPVGDSATTKTGSVRYTCSTTSSCWDETNSNLFQSFTSTTAPNTGIGTSYAAPQVSAAAAILWSDTPTATRTEIEAALKNSATDLGTAGVDDQFGYGLLNLEGALGREQNVPDPEPDPEPEPGDGDTGGSTPTTPIEPYYIPNSFIEFKGKLYQSITDSGGLVYVRSSSDGVNWSNWWTGGGTTRNPVSMIVHDNKLFQAVSALDSTVYVRYTLDGVNWTPWRYTGGLTRIPVSMLVYKGKIFQAVAALNNVVYYRSSIDGINWEPWRSTGGMTTVPIALAVFNDKLYMTVSALDYTIYNRNSSDGVNWTPWVYNGGLSQYPVTMISFSGKLTQSVSALNNTIYSRSSADGTNFTSWKYVGGLSTLPIAGVKLNDRLIQAVTALDYGIYSRETLDGTNWGSWRNTAATTRERISLTVFNGKVYQSFRGTDGRMYVRSSTDGLNWGVWISSQSPGQ